jgi:hypothetical protein
VAVAVAVAVTRTVDAVRATSVVMVTIAVLCDSSQASVSL